MAGRQPALVYVPAVALSAAVAVPAVLGIGSATAQTSVRAAGVQPVAVTMAPLPADPASGSSASAAVPAAGVGRSRAERALPGLAGVAPPAGERKRQEPAPRPAWVRPDVGHLSSGYGHRPSMGDFHPGIDLAGPYGSPIRAAAAGRVTFAGPASGFGRMIRITHPGGIVTVYGHMSRILVRHGEVRAGQVIALEGSEGHSTGPHLHFEVHVRGHLVDPLAFLRRHGVRI